MELILYTLLIVSVFDAFSRIAGQLFSKKKSLLPEISPGKTFEGTVFGAICALAASVFLRDLPDISFSVAFLYTTGIIASAFTGDLAASWYRRRYKAREFSKTLPGLGGILDCFCSLIAAGTFIYLLVKIDF
jgi:phosphatidate cytidylyltransferase